MGQQRDSVGEEEVHMLHLPVLPVLPVGPVGPVEPVGPDLSVTMIR